MRLFLVFLLASCLNIQAQHIYPQNYFSNPLDIPLVLSGTFAELRSNHFHSGLDIKTQQRKGLKVFTTAEGFVSRIKVAHFGYGKALYITHPNGYTSVYAHLQKFSPKIEAYIKAQQYTDETFEIELFPSAETLQIEKGEVVAYSGNTGSSGGPHLHFEIRNKQEHPINPLFFGIDIKDTTKPVITSVYAYPIGEDSHINKSGSKQKLRLIPLKNGNYNVETIQAFGKIGFGIATTDRQDMAANKNGVFNIETSFNGNKNFELDFSSFSFDETKHLNRLIDYEHFKKNKQRVQKLFLEANNPLSMYKNISEDGVITVEDSTSSIFKVRITDYKNNSTTLTITINGNKTDDIKQKEKDASSHFVYANQKVNLSDGNVSVYIPEDTFYDSFYMDFQVNNDTLKLHKNIIPAKKYFSIYYNTKHYNKTDKEKLYIARLVGYKNYPLYSRTTKKGDTLITRTKTLGTYALALDTIKPTIKSKNFKNGAWLSKYRYLKVKIDDKFSGISNYRATVNGKWILMEYDYKTKTLTHDFNDNIITDTKNNLKVIVIDNVGNSSTFETTFFRK